MQRSMDYSELLLLDANERFLSIKEVVKLSGLSKSTIYLYIQKGYFPSSMKLGIRRVGWLESEVRGWVIDKVRSARSLTN